MKQATEKDEPLQRDSYYWAAQEVLTKKVIVKLNTQQYHCLVADHLDWALPRKETLHKQQELKKRKVPHAGTYI